MQRIKYKIIVLITPILILFSSTLTAREFPESSLLLLQRKCTICHSSRRIFDPSSSIWRGKAAETVARMNRKVFSAISPGDEKILVDLLSTSDPEQLKIAFNKIHEKNIESVASEGSEVDEEYGNEEADQSFVMSVHALWQMTAFFLLGLYMLFSGLNRYFANRHIALKFIVQFNWKNHIKIGKVYFLAVTTGFSMGLVILWQGGLHIGSMLHFWIGIATVLLICLGGGTGMLLSKGKAKVLRLAHTVCNLAATVLFILNIVTGIVNLPGN